MHMCLHSIGQEAMQPMRHCNGDTLPSDFCYIYGASHTIGLACLHVHISAHELYILSNNNATYDITKYGST